MKKLLVFRNLYFVLSISVCLFSCKNADKEKTTTASETIETKTAETELPPATTNSEKFEDFDWNTVPESGAAIGSFPYLMTPAGFFIQGKGSDETTTGYTTLKDFNKLIIYNGKSFYNAEGKVARLIFKMKSADADWNQYGFDSNIDKYLQSIGAILIGKLKLSNEQKDFLNKEDDMTIYNHIVGDPYNEPVRFYALKTAKAKIMFQVFSNSASGEVGVVELAALEQTMKAPTNQ